MKRPGAATRRTVSTAIPGRGQPPNEQTSDDLDGDHHQMYGDVESRRKTKRGRNAEDRTAGYFSETDVPFRHAVVEEMQGLDEK